MYHAAMGMQGAAAALLSPGQMVTGGMWPQRAPRPRARAASQVAVAGISSVVRTSASSEHQHQ